MKAKSKKCVGNILEIIEEYRQLGCVESRELDLVCLLVKLCSVSSKLISEPERYLLSEQVIELIDIEANFAQKQDCEELKLLLESAKKMFIQNAASVRLVA